MINDDKIFLIEPFLDRAFTFQSVMTYEVKQSQKITLELFVFVVSCDIKQLKLNFKRKFLFCDYSLLILQWEDLYGLFKNLYKT